MSKLGTIGHRLYTGEISYDFIGHRRRWYILSAILIAQLRHQATSSLTAAGRATTGRREREPGNA